MAPPRRRSPSVEARWPDRSRDSPSRHRHRHPSPDSRHLRSSKHPPRRNDYPTTRDSSRRGQSRRSRVRSPEVSPDRAGPRSDVYRPDRPAASRKRDVSVSSVKRRREASPSPLRDRAKRYRRHGSVSSQRSRSPTRRDERARRASPDSYIPRRRSHSRESHRTSHHGHTPTHDHPAAKSYGGHATSFPKDSRQPRDSERWERDSAASESRGHRRDEVSKQGSKYRKELFPRRHSPSRDHRHRSPEFRRPRSPTDKRASFETRDCDHLDTRHPDTARARRHRSPSGPRSPAHRSSKPKFDREDDRNYRKERKEHTTSRRSSWSPAGSRDRRHPAGRGHDDRERDHSRDRERASHRNKPRRGRSRSRTPVRSSTPDGKMSWRPPYDHRGPQPARGGWPAHDPRYSHSPPYQAGYHGSPHGQPGYSPQPSPYPPQNGHADPGYFNQQQSPPFNRPPAHQGSPYHHGSPTGPPPNGMFPPSRGGYRGSQAPYNQRAQQPPPVQTAGPHVRNLSWTPKTGTRGGHAPVTHGAAMHSVSESTTPSQEQPNLFNGTDNPFRPASKDLRVDDEAGKSGKSQSTEKSPTTKAAPEASQQHSPQIRFGLPKTGATPAVAKSNPFEKKKNPFEQPTHVPAAAASPPRSTERFNQRPTSQYESRQARDAEPRQGEYHSRLKGPKPALKQPDQGKFMNRRKGAPPVHWNPLPPSFGDKDLRKKLRQLRSAVVLKGHPVKELQWPVLKPAAEPAEEDDPPGLALALENMAIIEEEAYRENPKKRPKGQLPRLKEGEVLEKAFTKEIVTTRHKIRRPEKVLPEEYRNSNVYYRKPGNESVVGFGTYGKVFKAKHIYKGKDVALKRLRMEAEKDGFPITAMREMKILKHLEQREADGVIRLFEVLYEVNLAGSVGCFMAFEYMPHDLTGLLNHPTFALSDAQKKDLSYQMIDAIGFMHKQGVLHRDIKAANILVSHKGQIKLADFGLARFYDMDKQLHYTNRVVTIWYRAPELLYGQTEYGPPIDVWAAACVIVEIFTKHAIFPGTGRELNQLLKLWEVLGFPTMEEWPDVSKTEWYFMMRPKEDMRNVFAAKYQHRVSPELFDLLSLMLRYDPVKRPTAEQCLDHAFFKLEGPEMMRVTELEGLGDWHELESKRARKQREADERSRKDVEQDLLFGPPSCGQRVSGARRERDYKKGRLDAEAKRAANFSPAAAEPEAKKVKV